MPYRGPASCSDYFKNLLAAPALLHRGLSVAPASKKSVLWGAVHHAVTAVGLRGTARSSARMPSQVNVPWGWFALAWSGPFIQSIAGFSGIRACLGAQGGVERGQRLGCCCCGVVNAFRGL